MKIRFQADNDLNSAIVRAVVRREPGIDFRKAQAAQLHRVPDPQVLAEAARQGRVLVSHDFQTMPEHFREFVSTNQSPGVLLIPQGLAIGVAVDTLFLVWAATEPHEWQNRLCLVPSLATIVVGT